MLRCYYGKKRNKLSTFPKCCWCWLIESGSGSRLFAGSDSESGVFWPKNKNKDFQILKRASSPCSSSKNIFILFLRMPRPGSHIYRISGTLIQIQITCPNWLRIQSRIDQNPQQFARGPAICYVYGYVFVLFLKCCGSIWRKNLSDCSVIHNLFTVPDRRKKPHYEGLIKVMPGFVRDELGFDKKHSYGLCPVHKKKLQLHQFRYLTSFPLKSWPAPSTMTDLVKSTTSLINLINRPIFWTKLIW